MRERQPTVDSKDMLLGCAATRPTNFPALNSFQRQQPELCCFGTLPFSSRPPTHPVGILLCYSFFGSGRCVPPTLTLFTHTPGNHTQHQCYLFRALGLFLLLVPLCTVSLFLQQTMDHGYILPGWGSWLAPLGQRCESDCQKSFSQSLFLPDENSELEKEKTHRSQCKIDL
jgi:hypothetical protein